MWRGWGSLYLLLLLLHTQWADLYEDTYSTRDLYYRCGGGEDSLYLLLLLLTWWAELFVSCGAGDQLPGPGSGSFAPRGPLLCGWSGYPQVQGAHICILDIRRFSCIILNYSACLHSHLHIKLFQVCETAEGRLLYPGGWGGEGGHRRGHSCPQQRYWLPRREEKRVDLMTAGGGFNSLPAADTAVPGVSCMSMCCFMAVLECVMQTAMWSKERAFDDSWQLGTDATAYQLPIQLFQMCHSTSKRMSYNVCWTEQRYSCPAQGIS